MRCKQGAVSAFLVACVILVALVPAAAQGGRLIPGSCTIFCVSKGDSVFFGNNEDWRNDLTP